MLVDLRWIEMIAFKTLDRSPLSDDLLVPIAHIIICESIFRQICSSVMAFSVSYCAAVGPYTTSDQTQTHQQQQASQQSLPKKTEASSITYCCINSVDLRRHELGAVAVVFSHEFTKHVGARTLDLCRINPIITTILAIVRCC